MVLALTSQHDGQKGILKWMVSIVNMGPEQDWGEAKLLLAFLSREMAVAHFPAQLRHLIYTTWRGSLHI